MHENMHENHIIQVATHMNPKYIPYIKSSTIRSIHIQTYTVPFLFLRPGRVYRSFVRALNLVGAGPDSDVLLATLMLGGNWRGKGREHFWLFATKIHSKNCVDYFFLIFVNTRTQIIFFISKSIAHPSWIGEIFGDLSKKSVARFYTVPWLWNRRRPAICRWGLKKRCLGVFFHVVQRKGEAQNLTLESEDDNFYLKDPVFGCLFSGCT